MSRPRREAKPPAMADAANLIGTFAAPGLRLRRMLEGFDTPSLSEAAAVSEQMIRYLELGERNASPDFAARIAAALDLTLTQAVAEGVFTLVTETAGGNVTGS